MQALLEFQFDNNVKFKAAVNNLDATELRPQPLGRDKLGNTYWRTLDGDCNVRIYQENLDEESWRIVASNRDELAQLISVLRGDGPIVPPNLAGIVDEDSSTNSDVVVKPIAVEERDDSNESDLVPAPATAGATAPGPQKPESSNQVSGRIY